MIPGDLLSAFPHRQFHTLPGLLDSWAALPNSYPNACMPMQGGSLYHFYDGLWYDPGERRTHDLPCERRTRYRLSQPDTVYIALNIWSYHKGACLKQWFYDRCVPTLKCKHRTCKLAQSQCTDTGLAYHCAINYQLCAMLHWKSHLSILMSCV